MLGYVSCDPCRFVFGLDLEHVEVQVLPVESGDGDLRGVEPQDTDDVAADALGGGGGERGYGRPGRQAGDELADAEVRRTEILSPLRHAVGFVDGHQRDRHACGEVAEPFGFQSFGGHIQQFDVALRGLRQHHGLLVAALGGVDVCGRDAGVVERVYLVAHQGDQRGDDDGDAGQQRGRNLVAHGFSSAGRHHAEHVAPGEDRVDEP